MKLELISFKLCPFVQRSVITLLTKGIDYDITYIDLSDPPAWFHDISPFGKVPVLKVDDEHVLFESAVINEFIDESTPGSLQPEDPLQRALNRAWTEFASACLMDHFGMVTAADHGAYHKANNALREKLDWLEDMLEGRKFFNGDEPALVDFAFAPLFMRLEILNGLHVVYDREEFPNVAAWSDHLLALEAVQKSVVPDFEEIYKGSIVKRDGYAAKLFFA